MDELRIRGRGARVVVVAPAPRAALHRWARRVGHLLVPVSLVSAAAFAAGGMPSTRRPVELRLPPEVVYEKTVGADSAVVFRHETHVALAGQKCTGCHPRPFRMLTPAHRASHHEMDAGQSCGVCHDGRQAFGVSDRKSCLACHAGKPLARAVAAGATSGVAAGRRLPKPIAYARGEASPGKVTFRHETHVAKGACVACHPKLFAMKSAGTRPGAGMHEASGCGACHDGAKAFGVEDADACARCHVESGGSP